MAEHPLKSLEDMDDDRLALLSQEGSDEAMEFIVKKYRLLVRNRAKTYFLIGADRDDILQEGMIGLFKAVRDYKADRTASFKAFAEMCVTRQIITAVKTATRLKHAPLNTYISLDRPIYDEREQHTLLDTLSAGGQLQDPEEIMLSREKQERIGEILMKRLSAFESGVLSLYLEGKSYSEIGGALNKPAKAVDNALWRIKRKIERCVDEF